VPASLYHLLYNEPQQDAKVAQTTLTYILTVYPPGLYAGPGL